jgi:tRNA-Thr(GGU) m(6)t(6)A37 methyltransferase TsaA
LSSKKIEVKPIGFVKRASADEDVKNKDLISKIVLKKDLSRALEGIEDFSHIFVIFWLHKISKSETVLKVHPRGKTEFPLVGVFATRAPVRPNPVGLTLVELVKRERNRLWVKGLDAFDGTPILDIKPYDSWDAVMNPRIPKWLREINK